jgi:hypothetical protein
VAPHGRIATSYSISLTVFHVVSAKTYGRPAMSFLSHPNRRTRPLSINGPRDFKGGN